MFTGIVQHLGKIVSLTPHPGGARLVVDRGDWTPHPSGEPSPGDSICVSGVCLTVTEIQGATLGFDVVKETLDRTKLGGLSQGDAVNLEPAVTANQPLGGHFMQGHVDAIGTVARVVRSDAETRITIACPAGLGEVVVEKGSIAIDGVSLTIAGLGEGDEGFSLPRTRGRAGEGADHGKDAPLLTSPRKRGEEPNTTFDVALIPTTLELTTLAALAEGDPVNLEADIISKTVVHAMRRRGDVVDREAPAHAGDTSGGGGRAGQAVTMAVLRKAGFA